MRRRLFCLLVLSLTVLTACTTSNEQVRPFKISGGKKIWVSFNARGPSAAKSKIDLVTFAGFEVDKDLKNLRYRFTFTALDNETPSRVRVEDVSDDESELLVDDAAPQLKEGRWTGFPPPKNAESPHVNWLQNDLDSVRIFRFTISRPDGKDDVLYQALFYWGMLKSEARRGIGLRRPE